MDLESGQVDVLKLFPGVAAGKIIQPEVVRGQVNGCGMLGLGYGLTEAVIRENGKMLNIYSNKERIKYILEEFFYDIVNVNVNLPFWTRNLT